MLHVLAQGNLGKNIASTCWEVLSAGGGKCSSSFVPHKVTKMPPSTLHGAKGVEKLGKALHVTLRLKIENQ